ncbi:hypothetical protein XELAEV_18046691mg [Xenopus laevis]|uniref:Uncharacterized protein n=1 Tax=Xenopus laevis TaxID=8355 RepID=A0A974BTP8_XENLA|nr:hypothetical protein XELAEV_18046691mg [Xenopus laevis]
MYSIYSMYVCVYIRWRYSMYFNEETSYKVCWRNLMEYRSKFKISRKVFKTQSDSPNWRFICFSGVWEDRKAFTRA